VTRVAISIVLVLALLAIDACTARTLPPQGNVLLVIDTDAPLPSEKTRARGPLDPLPLFDTLRVETLAEGQLAPCAACVRETAATEETFRAGASFAVIAEPGRRIRVHVRLYLRDAMLSDRLPDGLEAWAVLPPMPHEGALAQRLFLPSESFGRPRGTAEAPIATATDEGTRSVGTWPGARRIACRGPTPEGMACVPGGAYVMGDPSLIARGDADADARRLVVLSPFFVDRHEVTVGAMRALGAGLSGTRPWSGSLSGKSVYDWCTYSPTPGTHDALPVDCITPSSAAQHCAARGGSLPSEAQFEYVAGAIDGLRFPWGDEPPTCDDAIFARGGYPGAPPEISAYNGACRPKVGTPEELLGLPFPADRETPFGRDVIVPLDLPVIDLAGNVSEWMADGFARQDSPCWLRSDTAVFHDPLCPTSTSTRRVTRGGSILHPARETAAAVRTAEPPGQYLYVGFRCVIAG
jgi:sulfatase modifying factor 1